MASPSSSSPFPSSSSSLNEVGTLKKTWCWHRMLEVSFSYVDCRRPTGPPQPHGLPFHSAPAVLLGLALYKLQTSKSICKTAPLFPLQQNRECDFRKVEGIAWFSMNFTGSERSTDRMWASRGSQFPREISPFVLRDQ